MLLFLPIQSTIYLAFYSRFEVLLPSPGQQHASYAARDVCAWVRVLFGFLSKPLPSIIATMDDWLYTKYQDMHCSHDITIYA